MVVVMASATRSADALINYALDDKPNQQGERYVMASGVNGLLVSVAKPQMRDVRKKWGKDRRGAYVQAYHVIQSFGKDELVPNDPDSWMTAQRLGRALAEDRFPGRQVLVVTQRDGITGCLHNHLVVNSVETRTGRSLNSSVVMHSRLVEAHERVLEAEGFEQRADLRQAFSDAKDRQERGELSGLRRAGSTVDSVAREYATYAQWEYEGEFLDEHGLPRDSEPFSTDVLKYRIEQALEDPTAVDWKSFVEAGDKYGVRIKQRGERGRGISYGMMRTQPDGTRAEPSVSDRRRSTTLGVEYEMDAVEQAFSRHADAQTTLPPARVTQALRLPAPSSASARKSIEERLREAMEEIDARLSAQRPAFESFSAPGKADATLTASSVPRLEDDQSSVPSADEVQPVAQAVPSDWDDSNEQAAPMASQDLRPVTPASEATSRASEATSRASERDDLRKINRRYARLGLPLLTQQEFDARQKMTPEQRRLMLKHPELFDDSTDGIASGPRDRDFD